MVGIASPSWAAGEVLSVRLTQTDGAPTFNADNEPGHDENDHNGIVRTNDTLTYHVQFDVNAAAGKEASFTLNLPAGVVLDVIPAYCNQDPAAGALSTLTPATVPAVKTPVTSQSWKALPAQVLRCEVKDRVANSSFVYDVVTKVRGEVPHATTLTATAQARTADAGPVNSEEVTTTVSAQAQYDVSKNGVAETPNNGYYFDNGTVQCSATDTRMCRSVSYPLVISVPAGGLGNSPTQGEITLTDDLSPGAFFPASYATNPKWVAAGANALATYGAVLKDCGAQDLLYQPAPSLGFSPQANHTNSVTDSGVISCAQPGGPGTPVSITIKNPDTTASYCPSQAFQPADNSVPADRCYVVTGRVYVNVPVQAITDLGVTVDGVSNLNTHNAFTDFSLTDIGGRANMTGANDPRNDYRDVSYVVELSGDLIKAFAGVPGAPLNSSPNVYRPSYPILEGPPGDTQMLQGNVLVLPGQDVISSLHFHANNIPTQTPFSAMACDTWDKNLLHLRAAEYPASTYMPQGQLFPSGGAAVWFSGQTGDSATPTYTIEYGNGGGGSGAQSTCGDADSPGGWFTDPAQVPGNDPTKAAQGIFTGVSQVRIFVNAPPATTGVVTSALFSIGMRVAETATTLGTVVPNWAGSIWTWGNNTKEEVLAQPWSVSQYNPAQPSGGPGDRLTISSAYARLSKQVKGPYDADFSTGIPQATGGQVVQWRLAPTLNAGVPTTMTRAVRIEDCLPSSVSYLSSTQGGSTIQPQIAKVIDGAGMPAGAELQCQAGETYVRYDLGQRQINLALDPVIVTTRVKVGASAGTYTNTAAVKSEGDLSALGQRQATARFMLVSPSGIYLDKTALTPVVQVNPAANTQLEQLKWQLVMANINTSPAPQQADIIDVLPRNGVFNSMFHGDLTFESITVTAGNTDSQQVQVLYTAGANVSPNPADPSNSAAGATPWCDAISGGSVVMGSGACPTGAASLTGVRLVRPGAFGPGDQIEATLVMTPSGNQAGDLYENVASATATGMGVVGPVPAPETVVGATLGDYVWNDLNFNGTQDGGEPAVPDVKVRITGTDDLGNEVDRTTSTGADGQYHFTNLRSGTYTVEFVQSSLPAGYHYTFQNVAGGTPATDSDADPLTGKVTYTVSPGENYLNLDQGIIRYAPAIAVEKTVNKSQAPTAPGVAVPVGSTMQFSYVVTNSGNVTLDPVVVADNQVALTCPATSLAAGASMVCQASLAAPAPGEQHTNVVTAVGTPPAYPDGTRLPDVRDTATAHAYTFNASIALSKYVADAQPTAPTGRTADGQDSDANTQAVVLGKPGRVEFSYRVTNTSQADLTEVAVTDDKLGAISCPQATLAAGASMTCVAAGDVPTGSYQNTATVTATPPAVVNEDGTSQASAPVSAQDIAQVRVPTPQVAIVKYVSDANPSAPTGRTADGQDSDANSAPGVQLSAAGTVTFSYRVTNTGDVDLETVRISDDKLGDIDCQVKVLAPGASTVCTATGEVSGRYTNTGTVTAQTPRLLMPDGTIQAVTVTAADEAHLTVVVPPTLPRTGVDGEALAGMLLLSGAFLLAGLVLIAARRAYR